jgi:hypothetical protein
MSVPELNSEKSNSPRIEVDLLKFIATSVLAAFFFSGFSFTNSYFRSFGLGIIDIDLEYIDLISRGVFLLQDWRVLLAAIPIVLGAVFLQTAWVSRSSARFYLIGGLAFLATAWGAGGIGVWIGKDYGRGVTLGKYGKVAYCRLKEGHTLGAEFAESFTQLTLNSRMRKVLETEHAIYLSATLDSLPEGFNGASFEIPRGNIAYCRFVGD